MAEAPVYFIWMTVCHQSEMAGGFLCPCAIYMNKNGLCAYVQYTYDLSVEILTDRDFVRIIYV